MATDEMLQGLMRNPERLKALANEAKEFALQHGVVMRTVETPDSSEVVTYAPFTLFPTPVPKAVFHQALAVQTHFNTLVDKISQDPGFLEEALASTIQADDFTAKLLGIYRQVQHEGRTQSIMMGVNRSDYMLDQREDRTSSLKQIEINTIAAGGFGVADHLPVVHRHILRLAGLLEESQCVPDNNSTAGIVRALAKAWELYGQQNIYTGFIHYLRQGGYVFAAVCLFYRYGDMPNHYKEKTWEARLLMERSLAVKCPDIGTHLAGTKKVQQELARPGVLERFFPDQPQVVEQIRATFAGQYTLDMGPEGDQTVAMSLAKPDEFVLKPQREGGGNNFFGEDIVRILEEVKGDKRRAAYILMDRIRPKVEHNVLLRRGLPLQLSSVCYEIGVLGAYVRHGGEMVLNEVAGQILRTKSIEHGDGGICSGVSVFDSPLIY
ncbi:glutathione synthetase-like [Centroberyx affinis]|uniref:glutathione synthetase-like n=1 Tax=Centroberyx affinis TaxID=166261 RepID=UPI003A5B9CDD